MKITCEYCNSYIDADSNTICPNCGATLGSAVKKEQELRERELEQRQKEEAERLRREKENDDYLMFAAGALGLAGLAAGSVVKESGKKIVKDAKKKKLF